jgi:hypothetical protein
MSITAHGSRYSTASEANARIAELNEENARLGASDGRVTEILLVTEAMQEAGWEQTPQDAHREQVRANTRARYQQAPALPAGLAGEVRDSERRIAWLEANPAADDGKWRYLKTQDDDGRIKVRREYKTEVGFLRAYVREARRGHDILIAE